MKRHAFNLIKDTILKWRNLLIYVHFMFGSFLPSVNSLTLNVNHKILKEWRKSNFKWTKLFILNCTVFRTSSSIGFTSPPNLRKRKFFNVVLNRKATALLMRKVLIVKKYCLKLAAQLISLPSTTSQNCFPFSSAKADYSKFVRFFSVFVWVRKRR